LSKLFCRISPDEECVITLTTGRRFFSASLKICRLRKVGQRHSGVRAFQDQIIELPALVRNRPGFQESHDQKTADISPKIGERLKA
jgi:hypothetical protein